jgi:hypothetical protein
MDVVPGVVTDSTVISVHVIYHVTVANVGPIRRLGSDTSLSQMMYSPSIPSILSNANYAMIEFLSPNRPRNPQ